MTSRSQEQTQIEILHKKIRQLQVRNLISLVAILGLAGFVILTETHPGSEIETFKTVVAQQVIVKDHNGKERILIAPAIGKSETRRRSDTLSGVLIMDAQGNDRVIVGASPTAQSGGEVMRRADDDIPYGLAFNDAAGNERGGFGYYSQRGLVSFGMDNASSEGLTMFVADESFYGQKAGIVINREGAGQVIYIGHNIEGEAMINLDAPGKGRLAMLIDSASIGRIQHSDYLSGRQSTLIRSK